VRRLKRKGFLASALLIAETLPFIENQTKNGIMKKVLYIIAGLIVLADLIYGFATDQKIGGFFGFEMDIWIHRLILFILLLLFAWNFYRLSKSKNKA
jgi:CDP-diglyceride synthetase